MDSKFDDFYVRFQEHFRGSHADIKERQSVYLGCLNLLNRSDALREILDIGSGRGEWLELLRDEGWRAYGRDINEVMVQQCRALGLDVEHQDALEHLRSLPDGALTAVTGFHIVEHVPFEVLLDLFTETFRVLKPGGMIIFETPNPENLQVGAHTFYLDPTHFRPLAPSLLKFIADQAGFHFSGILRLHPYQELGLATAINSPIDLHASWLFFGPQDYSVLAVKGVGDDSTILYERMAEMISTINQQAIKAPIAIGETLRAAEEKARQAEDQVWQAEEKARQAEEKARQVENQVRQVEDQVRQTDAFLQELEKQKAAAEASAHQYWQQANEWHERVIAVHNSISWKLTRPIRALGSILQRPSTLGQVFSVSTSGTKDISRRVVISTVKCAGDLAQSSEVFKRCALLLLKINPGLQQKLSGIYMDNQHDDQRQQSTPLSVFSNPIFPSLSAQSQDDKTIQHFSMGINAKQRSPLEAQFHAYRGNR